MRSAGCDAGKPRTAPKTEVLLLDVRVNHEPLAGIIRAECMIDGRLALPAEVWTEAHLKPAGPVITMSGGMRGFALEASPGVVYTLDRSKLALEVTAPATAYESNSMSLATRRPVPTDTQSLGVYLNYDISADHTEGLPTITAPCSKRWPLAGAARWSAMWWCRAMTATSHWCAPTPTGAPICPAAWKPW